AFGVTTMRSGPSAPCATSRAFSCSIATAATSWRIKCREALMSRVSGRRWLAARGFASRTPLIESETTATDEPGAVKRAQRRTRQRGTGIGQAIRAGDAAVIDVTEIGEPAGALAERELERRNRGQLVAKTELFNRVGAADIADAAAFTKTVVEDDRLGRRTGR